ncbi:MAG: hypothetical protein FJZ67_06020, partial [Bacteroidetes bacterium]|nr:hypothetical protein [Bacteroidota bacterium]
LPVEPFGPEAQVIIEDELLELTPENIQILDQNNSNEPLKNMVRDNNDARQKSFDDYSQNKSSGDPAKTAIEYEQKLFEEAGGRKEREKIVKEMEDRKSSKSNQTNSNASKSNDVSQSGKQNQYAGNVMVDFSVPGRTAFEGNNWYVRNPGYTCGRGSGTVYVAISVSQSGYVSKATYDPSKSKNASSCMIEQAEKYAKLSRFNYSGIAPTQVSGYIIYQFVSQ